MAVPGYDSGFGRSGRRRIRHDPLSDVRAAARLVRSRYRRRRHPPPDQDRAG